MFDSRIHHRFASDVKRTGAGITMLRADPPRGWGERARGPMEVAAGAGPREWSVRAFFAFSLLGIGWVGCSALLPGICSDFLIQDTGQL